MALCCVFMTISHEKPGRLGSCCALLGRLQISMKCHVANSSQAAALVAAIILGDASLLGAALGTPQELKILDLVV